MLTRRRTLRFEFFPTLEYARHNSRMAMLIPSDNHGQREDVAARNVPPAELLHRALIQEGHNARKAEFEPQEQHHHAERQ